MRRSIFLLFVLISFFSCTKDQNEIDCDAVLFGNPSPNTGLNSEKCQSTCVCTGFEAKDFSQMEIDNLKSWSLTNAPDLLDKDPYIENQPLPQSGVCAVVVESIDDKTYSLKNFSSKEEAEAAGAILTHYGPCGSCSSLQDLSVYVENQDLGGFTRNCGFQNIAAPFENLVACLEGIGFTTPCAQIWSFNVKNTQAKCLDLCIDDILIEIVSGEKTPFNNPDGSLNECIACDENISGPVFKSYAGRTRRNSGLPSAICRPCDDVKQVDHEYPL